MCTPGMHFWLQYMIAGRTSIIRQARVFAITFTSTSMSEIGP